MSPKGFLLVLMQPPVAFEEEFNAWYDTEHLPERLAVTGFETALRFSSTGAAPKYLAMYDMNNKAALDSESYARVSGANFSPWTRRVTSRVKIYRAAGDQVYPGNLATPLSSRVRLLRFRGLPAEALPGVVDVLRRSFEDRPSTLHLRVFANPVGDKIDFLGFVSSSVPDEAPLDPAMLGDFAATLDLVNSYVPY
jgi:hypothetical protein